MLAFGFSINPESRIGLRFSTRVTKVRGLKGSSGLADTSFVIPANTWNPEIKPTKNGPPFFNEGDEGSAQDKL